MRRSEASARTREKLLTAATKLFCKKGLAQASIDDVASEAGYTKGAFYANFASKEELFLAMLDDRFAERIAALDALMAEGQSPEATARAGGEEFLDYVSGDPEWERLFFEFAAYAARDEAFREELVARYRTLIDRIATVLDRQCEQLGLPMPADRRRPFAVMLFAAANGMALQQLLDPDDVPDGMFASMLELLVLGALSKSRAQV